MYHHMKISPIQCVQFRQQLIHVKRDDILPLEGNKAQDHRDTEVFELLTC